MLPVRTILHPTDFSEHSRFAFRLACALARDYGARLVVLHVGPPPGIVYGTGPVPVEGQRYQEELQEQFAQVQAPHSKVTVEHRLVLSADPAGAILSVAGELGCDVIVLGTHGRTGLRRALLGSVAEQVVRKAPCPVLTVKAPPKAAPGEEVASEEPART
jgi:nucleotide-binding universal stress UspA family protein